MPRMLPLSINEDMTSTPLLLPFDGSPDALHAVCLLAGWTDTLICASTAQCPARTAAILTTTLGG